MSCQQVFLIVANSPVWIAAQHTLSHQPDSTATSTVRGDGAILWDAKCDCRYTAGTFFWNCDRRKNRGCVAKILGSADVCDAMGGCECDAA